MALGRTQQSGELAEHVGPDRFALERPGGDSELIALGDRHREMV